MLLIFIVLPVLKEFKFNDFNEEQEANILFMSVTFSVLNEDKLIADNDEQ